MIQIDMEMPKSCKECPFEKFGDCYGGKAKYIMDIEDCMEAGIRHPNCPLKDEQPTIDAVKVVRCKDCKHSETLTETDGTEVLWCEKMFDLHGFCEEVKPNHYCGYRERKEETDG